MTDKLKGVLIAAAVLAVLAIGGAAIATAAGGDGAVSDPGASTEERDDDAEGRDDDAGEADEQVTDATAADRAEAAALEAAGGGTVTEVELADEGDSGYEVEVERSNGSFVEVALDEAFDVVSVEADDD